MEDAEMTENNRYLERHVYSHRIERSDGSVEDVPKDTRDRITLTEEGRRLNEELTEILCSSNSSFWGRVFQLLTVYTPGASILLGILAGSAILFLSPLVGKELYWAAIACGTTVCCLAIVVSALLLKPIQNRSKLSIAPQLIQFVAENPEFMQALAALNTYSFDNANSIIKMHESRQAA